ncbi:hypothetical protein DXG01_010433 [Tephrocybe rancida]|nr:hypothetical protein DXG01_010433 [Tephrocybe rancida]
MIPLFNDVAQRLQKALTIKLASGAQEIDILHWMGRTALQLIGQSGLGDSFDPLVEGAKPHPFSDAVKAFNPSVSRRYHSLRDIVDTWDRTTTDIFEEKRTALRDASNEALAKQVGQAKDLMSILSHEGKSGSFGGGRAARQGSSSTGELTIDLKRHSPTPRPIPPPMLFHTLRFLSMRTEVQDRLRAEIVQARKAHGVDIPYEDFITLPLMDGICRETLRLHAPVPKDIVLPLSTSIKGLDGTEMDLILVPKNTTMIISILGANRDPLLWDPDVLKWKPEQWLSPLPEAVHEAHMPGIYSRLFVIHTLYRHEAANGLSSRLTFLGGGRAGVHRVQVFAIGNDLIFQLRFIPSEKEIVWEMSGITTPMLKGFPGQPKLPLKMELVNA